MSAILVAPHPQDLTTATATTNNNNNNTMAAFYGGGQGDFLQAVVADVGQAYTKVGWAGTDTPKAYFRSNVAVLREEQEGRSKITDVRYDYHHRPIQSDGTDGAWQVTNPVNAATGLWMDPSPAQADWYDLIPHFVRHAYESSLNSSADRHPMLLVERSYNPPPVRQHALECLFEECQVPAAFLAKDAVLSCYATGRTTATVVDMGYGGTTVSPVTDGHVEAGGVQRSCVGVAHMDALLLEHLDQLVASGGGGSSSSTVSGGTATAVRPLFSLRHVKRGAAFWQAARRQLAADCREAGAGAAVNGSGAVLAVPHKAYTLPDGTTVQVASAPRFAAAHLVLGQALPTPDAATATVTTPPVDPSQRQRDKHQTERLEEINRFVDQIGGYDEKDAEDSGDLYSPAAAVGLSKRRTKRSRGSKKAAATMNALANPRRLHLACLPALQRLRDEYMTAAPVAQMVCDAAYKCDRELQASLLGTVILAGGGSCLGPTEAAVPEFVKDQIEATLHQHTPGWRVKLLAPEQRALLPWMGGSILASLGAFHEMWITAADYEEWGSAIVNRKCP